nr:MAG TPA: hypothetical protein [Caudoviricetes sp.]
MVGNYSELTLNKKSRGILADGTRLLTKDNYIISVILLKIK